MNESLSLYLLDTLKFLDSSQDDYSLRLLSLIEAITENPQVILRKQVDKIAKEKLAEMKGEGVEYEDRIEELEKIEHPKPLRDFIYDTYNKFSLEHPWAGENNINPKSIAREMFENYYSFSGYIKEYKLEKTEASLLRHLASIYKILIKTIPDYAKNDDVDDIIAYLKTIIKETDSSLINEWEKLQHIKIDSKTNEISVSLENITNDIKDEKQFKATIKDTIFRIIKLISEENIEEAFSLLDNNTDIGLSIDKTNEILNKYFLDHEKITIQPKARHAKNIIIKDSPGGLDTEVTITDSKEYNDWSIKFFIDRKKFCKKKSLYHPSEYSKHRFALISHNNLLQQKPLMSQNM